MSGKNTKSERRGATKVEAIRPQPPRPKRWPLLTIRTLAAAGLVIGTYLSVLHYQAGTGGTIDAPLCGVGTVINCNAVLGSQYARLFGVPVATWAALTYAAVLLTSFSSLTGLLILLCGWAFAFSAYMAGLSAVALKTACLFCLALYAINTGLFVAAVALARAARAFTAQQAAYGAAACAMLLLGFGWWQSQSPSATASIAGADPEFVRFYNSRPLVALQAAERHTKGPAGAAVTVSEFVDFR